MPQELLLLLLEPRPQNDQVEGCPASPTDAQGEIVVHSCTPLSLSSRHAARAGGRRIQKSLPGPAPWSSTSFWTCLPSFTGFQQFSPALGLCCPLLVKYFFQTFDCICGSDECGEVGEGGSESWQVPQEAVLESVSLAGDI